MRFDGGMKRLTLLAAAAALLPSCQTVPLAAPDVVTQAYCGQTVALERGGLLTVQLASNGTTGYMWQVAQLPANLRIVAAGSEAPPEPMAGTPIAGAPGTQTFRFQAAKAGPGTLHIVYRQPWDKGAAPAQSFRLKVLTR
jgi:inhibitor of cysteine peptidase